MREILQKLNEQTGSVGSMVVTPDGIMVAADLRTEREEDSTAAFVSSMLLILKRHLSSLSLAGDMKSCTFRASEGKLLLLDMVNSYLVVLAESDQDLDIDAQPIHEAVREISSRRIT